MTWYNIIEIFAIPSHLLLILALIRARKNLSPESYFTLVLTKTIDDLLYCVIEPITVFIILHKWKESEPTITGTIYYALNVIFVSRNSQQLFFIAINRAAHLVKPLTIELIWTKRVTNLIICFQWVVSTLFGLLYLVPQNQMTYKYSNSTTPTNVKPGNKVNKAMMVTLAANGLLTMTGVVISYMVCLAKVIHNRMNPQGPPTNGYKTEIKLSIQGFLLSSFSLIRSVGYVAMSLCAGSYCNVIHESLVKLSVHAGYISDSAIVFAMCKPLRDQAARVLKLKSANPVAAASAKPTAGSPGRRNY